MHPFRPLLPGFLAGLMIAAAIPPAAAEPAIGTVLPAIETANFPDNDHDADADDPAFWVDPANPGGSLILAAVKNGGIRVFDLAGKTVQVIDPATTAAGEGRINNIDVAYGFRLADGSAIDIAVASDRGLDVIRVFRIDPGAASPLTEITDETAPRAFPTRAKADGGGEEENPVDDQNTVYGVALWNDRADGTVAVVGTQRHQPRVGVFTLVPAAGGKVRAELARTYDFPATHDGQDLFAEVDGEPLKTFSPQFEGSVVDQETGIAYLGQEDVGIWRIDLGKGVADAAPVYATRGSTASSFNNPSSVIARDVEGLTIYYDKPGEKYLIASSQGGAHGDEPAPDAPYDDTFAVFDISGEAPHLLGSFRIGGTADGIDAVQESDGADVIGIALPGWPNGLFVTQDGYNDDLDGLSGEPSATNFKLVDWKAIADSFAPPLAVSPDAWNPRPE